MICHRYILVFPSDIILGKLVGVYHLLRGMHNSENDVMSKKYVEDVTVTRHLI